MMALALLFSFGIVMNGSTFAAIQGRFAQKLEVPGAGLIPYVPWISVVVYLAAVFAMRRMTKPLPRWTSFVVATVIANALICYPIYLLDRTSIRIPIPEQPTKESRDEIETKYPVKWVSYSTSYEGACLRVRKDQYSGGMAAYIAGVMSRQAEQVSRGDVDKPSN